MNRIRWAVSALTVAASVSLIGVPSAHAYKAPKKTPARKAASKALVKTGGAAGKIKPLPRFVSMDTIQTLRALRGEVPPRLQDPIPPSMPELMRSKATISAEALMKESTRRAANGVNRNPKLRSERLAQLPTAAGRVAPARVRRQPAPVVPKWVRYPLEFQLGGIGLGSKAIDKDRYNRIDRYGLFAMHGNPTAVVVPVVQTGGAAAGGAAGGGAAGGAPGAGGAAPLTGGAAAAAATAPVNLTVNQTPPFGAELFPGSQNGELPDWASAVTVQLDNNHVEWLYNRGTYAMGFVVDRLGYVDAIVMAGVESPIGKTQLEDPVHTVKLGDDLRKVMSRYGYPDSVETYIVNISAGVGIQTGAPGADAGAAAGGAAAGAGAAAGGAAASQTLAGNGAFRTFELRYEQSYNVVFTIRYNRVVRIYIFGDPDFFSEQRRRQLRVSY